MTDKDDDEDRIIQPFRTIRILLPSISISPAVAGMRIVRPDPGLRILPDIPGGLLGGLADAMPPNWDEVPDLDYMAAIEVINEGVPLIWVPRGAVIERIMAADDAAERDMVLMEARAEIAEDCAAMMDRVTDPDLLPLACLASNAARALRDGYCAPAQALATNVIDTWLREAARRGVIFTADEPMNPGFYGRVRQQLSQLTGSVRLLDLKHSGTLAPVLLALARFDARVEPKPERFGRHATAHAAYPEQYTDANAVIAVMLATSLLRQSQESGW